MEIIGVDIGFSANRRTSGVARLSGSNLVFDRTGSNWASRVAVIGDNIAEVTAMDGPLLGDSKCRKRVCETIFAMGAFSRRCKPGFSHVSGTGIMFRAAGEETGKQLTNITSGNDVASPFPRVWSTRNLVEAFPNAFLGVMIPDARFNSMPKLRRGKKFDWLYEQCRDALAFRRVSQAIGLENARDLLVTIEATRDHEKRAALVCLLTAAAVAVGRYTAVGNDRAGYFFLPPWDSWAMWARQELDKQRNRVASVDIWINGSCFNVSDNLPGAVSADFGPF